MGGDLEGRKKKTAVQGDRGFWFLHWGVELHGHFHTGFELAALGLAHAAAAFFAGLFEIGNSLHVFDEAFLFAEFFEAAEHLLGGLVAAAFDFDHAVPC